MYQSAYLVGAFIFGLIWLIFFWRRPDLRREMLILSLLAGIMGPVSEHFYLTDYWRPEYWFPALLRIEDFLAGFFLGGIAAVGYEIFWRRRHQCACDLKTTWILPVAAFLGLASLIFFFHIIGFNSIYSSIISFTLVAGLVLAIRRDLLPAALGSGFVLSAVMFTFYLIYQQLYPGIIPAWWQFQNLTGLVLLGVPIEELLWGFSWGMVAGPLYEFAAKVKIAKFERGWSIMKSNKLVIANTVALWAAVAWTTCTAFVWLLPGFSGTILSWWTHGRWPVTDINITFISFIAGGITLVIAGWIYGWLFGWSWEKVSGKK